MDTRYSKQAFIGLDDEGSVTRLCKELETVLESRMHDASEVRLGMEDCIRDLRQFGHDLWGFDGSNEFESWCPNYANPTGPGIVLTFVFPNPVSVEWSST